MAESLFASLLHSVDHSSIAQLATSLGESEQSISRGLESSIAASLGAITNKADDPSSMRHILSLLPVGAESTWTKIAAGLATPGSTWISNCKQIVSAIFGPVESAVEKSLASESGVGAGTAKMLLAMAGPMVLAFLNRKVMTDGLRMEDLGSLLKRESSTVRSALPTGLSNALWPRAAEPAAAASSPIIAQAIVPERHSNAWIGAACMAALGLMGYWIWSNAHRPVVNVALVTGRANRLAGDSVPVGDYVRQRLPGDVEVFVPVNGMESQLIGAIATRTNGWIGFDRIMFPTGSDALDPSSSRQVDNIAAILRAYPNVHLLIAGYAESIGPSEENMRLSWARANVVKNELMTRGIAADRLTTEGQGEASSNNDAAGRANNRTVAVQITQQ
jgi:OOP family OmpA-OmpF porin